MVVKKLLLKRRIAFKFGLILNCEDALRLENYQDLLASPHLYLIYSRYGVKVAQETQRVLDQYVDAAPDLRHIRLPCTAVPVTITCKIE